MGQRPGLAHHTGTHSVIHMSLKPKRTLPQQPSLPTALKSGSSPSSGPSLGPMSGSPLGLLPCPYALHSLP